MIGFNNFDLLPNPPPDHHYLKTDHQSTPTLAKAINKEWKMLKDCLPDSIYVRAYESKTHLMRAAIIGPTGTPYANALFFFDILLPKNYPNYPPQVYFHSHGLVLNPNLYKSGHVCLSLLNTWDGRKEEKWCKDQSTILQVLVSIQGLVLNEEPYYNEPLHFTPFLFKEWTLRSYNENVFRQSCTLMTCTLKSKPAHFEYFVERHFREKVYDILFAINNSEDQFMDRFGLSFAPGLFDSVVKSFEANGIKCQDIAEDMRKTKSFSRPSSGLFSKLSTGLVYSCLLLVSIGLISFVLVPLFL